MHRVAWCIGQLLHSLPGLLRIVHMSRPGHRLLLWQTMVITSFAGPEPRCTVPTMLLSYKARLSEQAAQAGPGAHLILVSSSQQALGVEEVVGQAEQRAMAAIVAPQHGCRQLHLSVQCADG